MAAHTSVVGKIYRPAYWSDPETWNNLLAYPDGPYNNLSWTLLEGLSTYQGISPDKLNGAGSFSSSSGWNTAAGWVISGGQLTCTTAAAQFSRSYYAGANLQIGKKYAYAFTCVSVSGGSFYLQEGVNTTVKSFSTSGTFSGTFTSTVGGEITLKNDQANSTAILDDLVVYEVSQYDTSIGFVPDPLGYNTPASMVVEDTSGTTFHRLGMGTTNTSGSLYEWSGYIKYGTRRYWRMTHIGALSTYFDLQNGTVASSDVGVSGSMTPVGSGWYFCTSRWVATGSGNTVWAQTVVMSGTDGTRVGDGAYSYIWGAKYGIVYTTSATIPVSGSTFTDFSASGDNYSPAGWTMTAPTSTHDFITAYRDPAIYQTSIKNTPGLMYYWAFDGYSLSPLVASADSLYFDTITNGGFDSDTWWNKAATAGTPWVISGGVASVNTVLASRLYAGGQAGGGVWKNGSRYRVVYTVTSWASGSVRPIFGNTSGIARSTTGTFSEDVTVLAGGAQDFRFEAEANTNVSIDNVSVRELGVPHFYNYKGQWHSGKCGEHCMSFNGTDSYLKTGADLDLSSTNKVAVECFVRMTGYDTVGARTFVEFGNPYMATTSGFAAYVDGGQTGDPVCLYLFGNVGYNGNDYYASNNKMNDLLWHHCIFVFDKSQATEEVSLYIDGVLLTKDVSRFTSNNTNNFGIQPLHVASRQGTSMFGQMEIDELAVYDMSKPGFNISNLTAHATLGRAGVLWKSNTTGSTMNMTSTTIPVSSGRVYKLGIKKENSENLTSNVITNEFAVQITGSTEFASLTTIPSTWYDGWLWLRFTASSSSITIKIQKANEFATTQNFQNFTIEQVVLKENYPDVPNIGLQGLTFLGQGTADTWTIPISSTVVYDYDCMSQLSTGSILGTFNVATDRSTKIVLSSFSIGAVGSYTCGTSSVPLPKEYTHDLCLYSTTNGALAFTIVNGGKFKLYGDPNFYGNQYVTTLYSDYSSGYNYYMTGDMTSKWKSGQTLYFHKNYLYGTVAGDSSFDAIGSYLYYDGVKTTTNRYVQPSIATPYRQDGLILNTERNVRLLMGRESKAGKLGVLNGIGTFGAPQPYLNLTGNSTLGNIVLDNIFFGGLYAGPMFPFSAINKCVFAHYNSGSSGVYQGATFTECIFLASNIHFANPGPYTKFYNCYFSGGVAYSFAYYAGDCYFENCKWFGNGVAFSDTSGFRLENCDLWGNSQAFGSCTNFHIKNSRVYYNVQGTLYCDGRMTNVYMGWDANGVSKNNTTDIQAVYQGKLIWEDCVFNGWTFAGHNTITGNAKMCGDEVFYDKRANIFINWNKGAQPINLYRGYKHFGYWWSDSQLIPNKTVTRLGAYSNCGANSESSVMAFQWFENNVPPEAQTRSVKVKPFGWHYTQDPSFEYWSGSSTLLRWTKDVSGGTGVVILDNTNKVEDGLYSVKLMVDSNSRNCYIYQTNPVTLDVTHTYRMKARFKGPVGAKILAHYQTTGGAYRCTPEGTWNNDSTTIQGPKIAHTCTGDWQTVTVIFSPLGAFTSYQAVIGHASGFGITNPSAVFYLDYMELEDLTVSTMPTSAEAYLEAEYYKTTGSELQTNGNFQTGSLSPWGAYSGQSGSSATLSLVSAGTNCYASVAITNGGSGSTTDVQFFSSFQQFSVTKGKKYRMLFDAKGAKGRYFNVSVIKHGAPYTTYGATKAIYFPNDDWNAFEYVFESGSTASDARSQFGLGWNGEYTFCIDNISVMEIVSTTTQSSVPVSASTPVYSPDRLYGQGDFSTWTGSYPNELPTPWASQGATRDINGHFMSQSPSGACRFYSSDAQTVGIYAAGGALIPGYTYEMTFTILPETTGADVLNGIGNPFTWSGDNPVGWTIIGEDATHYVTQHANGARYVSDTTTPILYMQANNVLKSGQNYNIIITIGNVVSGSVKIETDGLVHELSAGVNNLTMTANGASFVIYRATTNVDLVIQSVVITPVTKATGTIHVGDSVNSSTYSSPGTYTKTWVAGHTQTNLRTAGVATDMTIDNLTLKMVNYPIVADSITWLEFPVSFTPAYTQKVAYRFFLKKYRLYAEHWIENTLYRGELPSLNIVWRDGETVLDGDYTTDLHKYSLRGNRKVYG